MRQDLRVERLQSMHTLREPNEVASSMCICLSTRRPAHRELSPSGDPAGACCACSSRQPGCSTLTIGRSSAWSTTNTAAIAAETFMTRTALGMFGSPGDAAVGDDVTAACRWSASRTVVAPVLLESAGTASLALLPAAVAAEALGAAAALAWRRLLPGAAEAGVPMAAALNEVREANALGSLRACQREYR
jgi:hypothetical protein